MRKVKPTIQVLLICFACLFVFSATAQEIIISNSIPFESKKGTKTFTTTDLTSSKSTFIPKNQVATDAQIQQVQISVGNQQPAAAQSGNSAKKITYDPPVSSFSVEQLRQIKAANTQQTVPLTSIGSNAVEKSAVCSGVIDYSDANFCSTPLPVAVDINSCNFNGEETNADGTITIYGVDIFAIIPGFPNFLVASYYESPTTLASTVCTTPQLTIPENMTCDMLSVNFQAVTTISTVIDGDGGVEFTSKIVDPECTPDDFTINIFPLLEITIDEADPNPVENCGVVTAYLTTSDGTQCTPGTDLSCQVNGDVLSFEFDYPFDGIGCPEAQFMTVSAPCSGCPCAAEADFEDVTACTTADPVTINALSCTINAPSMNPDGTMLVPALEIYQSGAATPIAVLYQCASLDVTIPANEGCDMVAYSYDVVSVVQTQDADGNVISSTADDCTETFTVTILPELTAGIIEDQTSTATCGTLTVGLFDATGTLCPGSEVTGMCPMTDGDDNGGTVTVVLDNPYPDCGPATFEVTEGPCLGCDCSAMITYESNVSCSEDVNGDGSFPLAIPIADTDGDGVPDCNVTPEIDNGDGTLAVSGFDIYLVNADGTSSLIARLIESATFGLSACVNLNFPAFPVNTTCEPRVFNFSIESIRGIILDSGDEVQGVFGPDELCTMPQTFSITVNPTLSVQVIDDGSTSCGTITAALVAGDGTVCAGTEVTSESCSLNGDALSVTLTDPFGCVDPAALTVDATCSGCFEPSVASAGCDCFPDGIDLDGDGINDLAFVEIIITDNPGETGVDWTLDSSGGLFNPDGTPTTAMVMDNGDGTYTLTAYAAADNSTHTAVFTNTAGDVPLIFNSQMCLPCPPPLDEVPTVGEWGLIMLGLLMTITAVIGIRQRREEEAYA